MGNTASSNSVHVCLDREAYQAGSCVTGNLYVNAQSSSAEITALYIKVEGVEETGFTYHGRTSAVSERIDQDTSHIHCRGRTQFFSVTVPLQLPFEMASSKPSIAASQLEVPFSFHLPLGTRPSFSFEGRGIWANITYTVSAVVKADNVASNWSDRLECSTPLTVYSHAPGALSVPGTQVESSGEGDIADCCGCCMQCPAACMPCRGCACLRGHTWCHLGIDSSHVGNGGTLKPHATILNSSSIPVKCTLRLVRCIRVFGKSWQVNTERYSTWGSVSEVEAWRHVEACIRPDSARTYRIATTVPFPRGGSDKFPPSVLGELIQCSYRVEAVIAPVGGCCGSKIQTSVPVVFHTVDRSQPAPEAPTAPPHWEPVVLEQQEVALPMQGLITPQVPIGILGDATEPLLPPRTQEFAPMYASCPDAPVV
eukprot:jgi/Ulvmu1/12167/UM085_0031.1